MVHTRGSLERVDKSKKVTIEEVTGERDFTMGEGSG